MKHMAGPTCATLHLRLGVACTCDERRVRLLSGGHDTTNELFIELIGGQCLHTRGEGLPSLERLMVFVARSQQLFDSRTLIGTQFAIEIGTDQLVRYYIPLIHGPVIFAMRWSCGVPIVASTAVASTAVAPHAPCSVSAAGLAFRGDELLAPGAGMRDQRGTSAPASHMQTTPQEG